MVINIRGDKLQITEAIKDYVEKKIGRLDKYFENPDDIKANVLVRVRGKEEIVEVTIPIRKIILRAEVSHSDLYAAIDLALEKLERQIRKNKTRMSKKINRETLNDLNIDFEIETAEEDKSTIVKRKVIEMKPMSEEEAILQMTMLGHEFFAFKNEQNNETNILYIRKDGNYGIIEVR